MIAERWPATRPRIVHRVYRLSPDQARARFGDAAAAAVPETGLVDVHRFLVLRIDGRDVPVDATFPGPPDWDGRSPLPPACGPGEDHEAGADPDADLLALEESRCDRVAGGAFRDAIGQRPEA